MPRPTPLDTAVLWMNEKIVDLFHAEIANEKQGGVSPATIDSTIDSLAQGADVLAADWGTQDWTSFCMIISNVGIDYELDDLVRAYTARKPK